MKKFELSIPKPCHENWDAMTPSEQGRFCGACKKTVIDFSNMTDHQVAQFFKKPVGGMCGRFHPDQLDRTMEFPTKRIPWLKYFFTISLPAFLFSLRATAQREIVGKVAIVKERQWIDTTTPPTISKDKQRLKGRVAIKKTDRLKIEEVSVDSTLFAKAPNCVQPKIELGDERTKVSVNVMAAMLGGITFTPSVRTKTKEVAKLMPLKKKDTSFINFSVYPNPVIAGSSITVNPNSLNEVGYEYSILTSTGEVVQRGDVSVSGKTKSFSISVNLISAGPYFLHLKSKKTNKAYTEIIIVQ
jgi:hypothetical protein